MKYTLLELVQLIASSMDSDEVNSINDSVESLQIAYVVRTAYFDLIDRAKLKEHYCPFTLDATTDNTKPVFMTVPSTIATVEWVKYNKILEVGDPINMEDVNYLPLQEFLQRMYWQNTDETNIDSFTHTVGSDTYTIIYQNDKQPDYYTSLDDSTLLFDSLDTSIDTTLQKSKTLCYGKHVIPFTLSDSFTPDLDEPQFSTLLNEAKSLAWAELKQTQHGIAERNSRRGWSRIQKGMETVEGLSDFDKLPNFGRR